MVQAEGVFPAAKRKGANPPVVLPKENYTLNIIDNYRFKTEVDRDLHRIPASRPFNFLTRDDQFELSTEDWVYETSGINERPEDDSTQSARWTQLSETSTIYSPGPNGAISYNSAANSAQLTLSNNAGGFKRVLPPSVGIAINPAGSCGPVCSRLSVAGAISLTRLGVGDQTDGFLWSAEAMVKAIVQAFFIEIVLETDSPMKPVFPVHSGLGTS